MIFFRLCYIFDFPFLNDGDLTLYWVKNYEYKIIEIMINQHPLIFHFYCSATQQIHPQQSFSMLVMYFIHCKSAGKSFPFY
jgi:hypothetical protein